MQKRLTNPFGIHLNVFFLVSLITCSLSVKAQVNAPRYSNEFLAIGVGARALGMANTQVAIVEDATAGYWNPAGLLKLKDKYSVSLMHASYFAGIANYDFAAFATPIDTRSHLGVSLIRFGIDDIPDTRFLFDADGRLNYDNVRSFSAADYAFIFSYARRFPALKDIRFGGNVKVIHRTAGIFANAWGFGLDAGAQMDHNRWSFGVVGRDITGTFNAWSFNPETFFDVFAQTGNTIPDNSIELTLPRLIADAARSFTLMNDPKLSEPTEMIGMLVSAGFTWTFDGQRNTLISTSVASLDPHLGLEFNYKKMVFLRGGVGNFQDIKDFDGGISLSFQPNFGIGLKYKNFAVDYALTDIGDQSETIYSNVFSVSFGFGNTGFGKSNSNTPRFEL